MDPTYSIWRRGELPYMVQPMQRPCQTLAASQFAYLYYALKVCTLFVRKKYILLSV